MAAKLISDFVVEVERDVVLSTICCKKSLLASWKFVFLAFSFISEFMTFSIFLPSTTSASLCWSASIDKLWSSRNIYTFFSIFPKNERFVRLFYSWHKYKSLWMYDKKVICDKYLNRGIPLVRLDEKFIFFTQIINELENVKPHHDIKATRINLRPLIQSIIEHAVEWRNTLGKMVSDRTNMDMVQLNAEFKVRVKTPLTRWKDLFGLI